MPVTSQSYDWNLIRSFLAVLEHGTLTAAANALKISQPTLSRHIDELEKELDVLLFERGRRGAVPTEAALAIADNAREVEMATKAISLSATGKSQKLSGTVRITASQVVSVYMLPSIIAKLLKIAPEIEIELVSTDEVASLTEREADIAIRMVRPRQADLIAKKVNDIALGGYAHISYMAGRNPPREPHELEGHCIIGYDRADDIIKGMARAGIEVNRNFFHFRCDDQVACIRALQDGVGIGFAPNYVAKKDPMLMPLFEELSLPTLPVWLVTHREIRTNRRIRMVFDYLANALSKLDLS